jgi:hypothetical protein
MNPWSILRGVSSVLVNYICDESHSTVLAATRHDRDLKSLPSLLLFAFYFSDSIEQRKKTDSNPILVLSFSDGPAQPLDHLSWVHPRMIVAQGERAPPSMLLWSRSRLVSLNRGAGHTKQLISPWNQNTSRGC